MNTARRKRHLWNNSWRRCVLALFLMLALLVSSASASAGASRMTNVFIRFTQMPGPAEVAMVRGFGGEIRFVFDLVPAISAVLPEAALLGLGQQPGVTHIEPVGQPRLLDAELDAAWGVKRIGAGSVHAAGNSGSGIKIAILDTGIDVDHPDLTYDPSCSASFIPGQSLDDGHGHGTHIAGTIAAQDNDAGVVGASPAASLCIYKTHANDGSSSWDYIVAALEQAMADGVNVTNSSYGELQDPGLTVAEAFSNTHSVGMLHVAAAGNSGNFFGSGENCLFPARYTTVIATSATDQNDQRLYFSSTCSELELAAPGGSIYSTMPGGGYGYKSGTSMATPHAAGAAALVLAANPGWSNDQVRARLQATADDLGAAGRDPWYGFGLVDAAEAAVSSNSPPLAEDQSVATEAETPVDILLSATDPDGDDVSYYVVTGPSGGDLSGIPPNLTYTPYTGTENDSFTFRANDGLLDSNLATVSITVAPAVAYVDVVADGEMPVAGSIDGDYLATHADDGNIQTIRERESGGKPGTRHSYLEHKWTFQVAAGSAATFYINAWSSGSTDGDAFVFAYSSDDSNYVDMFTVANTSDDGYLAYPLPPATEGALYLRVTDSDREPGNRSLDTVSVDHLFVRTEMQSGDPPAAPTNLSATAISPSQIDLSWTDNAEDELGVTIQRSVDGVTWEDIDVVGPDVTSYGDTALSANTSYHYRVLAFNISGTSLPSNSASATTPDGMTLVASGYKVKGVHHAELTWSGGSISAADVYRDGEPIAVSVAGNSYVDTIGNKGGGSYLYQVCEAGNPANCSNTVRVDF